jgi:cytochrome b561
LQEDLMNRPYLVQAVPPALERYGAGAIAFHWIVAALIVFLGGLGLLFDDFPKASQPFWINVHGTVGLIYFALVLARIGWRFTHRPPDLPPDVGEFSRRTSHPVHLLLYALMVAIPALGIVAFVWHARAFDYGVFKIDFAIPLTRAVFKPAEDLHGWLAYGLFGLAGLHAVAALWHHFIKRDGVLTRMLPGGPG